jgi:hypothetical protein
MQPMVRAALLCDYALTSEDGKLSVVGIFGNINLATIPGTYPRFFVVIIVALDAGSHAVRVGIVDPMGQQMLPDQPLASVDVDVSGTERNLVVDLQNLLFNHAGIHQVQLYVAGRLIHSVPLTVQSASGSGFGPVQAS